MIGKRKKFFLVQKWLQNIIMLYFLNKSRLVKIYFLAKCVTSHQADTPEKKGYYFVRPISVENVVESLKMS